MAADTNDKNNRARAAESLKRQIENLVAETSEAQPPRNLRDFVAEKMAEDQVRKTAKMPANAKDDHIEKGTRTKSSGDVNR